MKTQTSVRALPVPGIRPDPTAAQLSDLFAHILSCERHERRIPLTVATLRATLRP